MTRRIIVLGGFGFFGNAVVDQLHGLGLSPLIGSRRSGADLAIDVEDRESIRRALRAGDVVVDAVGPFQERSMALVDSAADIGFDVIDLADSLDYVARVHERRERLAQSRIRVLTACSSVSTITAAMVRAGGVPDPLRASVFLAPAARHSAVDGSAASLLHSVGRPIRMFDDGRLSVREGWRSSRAFLLPPPFGMRIGFLSESADAIALPAAFPSLRTVEFYIDTNVLGLNALLRAAARSPMLRRLVAHHRRRGTRLSRWLGRAASALACEVESARGGAATVALICPDRGYLAAVMPAVLAVQALIAGKLPERGLVPHDRQVDPDELMQRLERLGAKLTVVRTELPTRSQVRDEQSSAQLD